MKLVLQILILLLAFALPFEIIHPFLVLPWFEFTNLELLAVAALGIWLVCTVLYRARTLRFGSDSRATARPSSPDAQLWKRAASSGRRVLAKYPLIWLPVLFLSLAALSALLAPAHRLDALKFVTRSAMGLAVFWMLIHTVRSYAFLVALLWALVLGAGVSGLVGLAEAAGPADPWSPLLELFKEAPTRVGGELRVSGSFQYATIAAMFFEMTVPLALALAATAQTNLRRWVALAIALLGTANIVLTSTRAGILTLFCVLLIMLVLAWRQPRFRPLVPPALLVFGTLVMMTGLLVWQAASFRTRMLTENDLNWYSAEYTAPPSLQLKAGEPLTVTVAIQNTGTIAWHATGQNPFALGYYWLADGQAVQTPDGPAHIEAPLPHPVAPGETANVTVTLYPALAPGDYQLVWGMLQHNILWFRHRDVPEAHTAVHIEEGMAPLALLETAAPGGLSIPGGEMPALPPTVRRLELWRAALRMWLERPLLGNGPDNFRLLYGHYLNLPDWDRRLHANNLYLELLAGWGLAGTFAFAGLILVITGRWLRLWQLYQSSGHSAVALHSLALGGSFLAFFIHGFLDYFLQFVSLYLLFWLVAGLIVALERVSVNVRTGWQDDKRDSERFARERANSAVLYSRQDW